MRWAPAGREGLAQRQTNLFRDEVAAEQGRPYLALQELFYLPLSTHDLLRRAVSGAETAILVGRHAPP